jgi:hypothetical protein
MKQTKVLGIIFGLFLLTFVVQPAKALVPLVNTNALKNIQPVPTNIPTPLLIKKIINPNLIKLISTSTPAPTVQPTVNPKLSPTVTPTIAEVTTTPTENPTATVTAQPAATGQSGSNMTFWFLIATIGLLAVIIVVQAWPKKNEED